jgi:hypothetical protein
MIQPFTLMAITLVSQLVIQENPIVIQNAPFVENSIVEYYLLGGMTEESRFFSHISYGGKFRKTPVVNGFVPAITKKIDGFGRESIWYDYTNKIPYSRVVVYQKEVEKVIPDEKKTDKKPSAIEKESYIIKPSYGKE